MQHAQRLTLEQMREFVASSSSLSFTGADRKEIYGLVERVWAAQHYRRLGKRQKGIVRRVLARLSGLSRAQLTPLMGQWLGPHPPFRLILYWITLPSQLCQTAKL